MLSEKHSGIADLFILLRRYVAFHIQHVYIPHCDVFPEFVRIVHAVKAFQCRCHAVSLNPLYYVIRKVRISCRWLGRIRQYTCKRMRHNRVVQLVCKSYPSPSSQLITLKSVHLFCPSKSFVTCQLVRQNYIHAPLPYSCMLVHAYCMCTVFLLYIITGTNMN